MLEEKGSGLFHPEETPRAINDGVFTNLLELIFGVSANCLFMLRLRVT